MRAARDLGDGLRLRAATEADLDGILAVETAAFGPSDGADLQARTETGDGPAHWAVVVDTTEGDRVVSASGLFGLDLSLDGRPVPVGQVEWVATYPEHQRRGLVRAQFDFHHERARELGHLATVVAGIPYLYRRFGYGYGIDPPRLFLFPPSATERLGSGSPATLRDATDTDIPRLLELDAERQAGLIAVRTPATWRRHLAAGRGERSDAERFVVAEEDGMVTGWARLARNTTEGRVYLLPGIAVSAAATDALMIEALRWSGESDLILVAFASSSPVYQSRLEQVATALDLRIPGYYTRVADPVALLDHLRPLLSGRLSASSLSDDRGTLEISLFNRGVALDHEAGEVTAVRAIPGVEDPIGDFGACVAPDWFGALVFGRWGAAGLADRADDVSLGAHAPILGALFPRVASDLATDL